MKEIFRRYLRIRLSIIIFFVLIILCLIVFFFYWKETDSKWLALLGSLGAGIIVAIIQFLISWQDYRTNEKLANIKIKNVLLNRDKREFYENFIKSAKKNIDVMGVTASRFMEHFANTEKDAPENAKVLQLVMSQGVKVRILLPLPKYLISESDKNNEKNASERFAKIDKSYSGFFQVKYFKHVPAHSIFLVDDECILGPIFPELSSKYTPALFFENTSPFAKKYIDYFENEWKKSSNEKN